MSPWNMSELARDATAHAPGGAGYDRDFALECHPALYRSSDDFVHADPPYEVEFTSHSMGGFDWDAQQRAARWLSKHPGPVVLSNQWTDRIVEPYKNLEFDIVGLSAPRLISCTGDRTPAKEVLATCNISVDRANAGPVRKRRAGRT